MNSPDPSEEKSKMSEGISPWPHAALVTLSYLSTEILLFLPGSHCILPSCPLPAEVYFQDEI